MKSNDRIFGLLMLVLAVAYGWGATQFSESSEAIGPGAFPILLTVVLVLSSLYLIVKPDPGSKWPPARTTLELLIAVVVLIAYVLLLQPLGFIITTTLAVGTLCCRMGAAPVRAYVVGLIAGIVVYFLFTIGLDLSLPLGVLRVLEGS
ncbi:tripartite tricarboxylate transporter TctB family protein [Chromohalobacter sp. 296-RDG]|uniref:tripartite tricarboxylate transporter TctB family protein n=1 Tax=Chromohalobacter sp. 296-RDG TaxID=2994062 RepID=UPI00246883A3|nr:tripartite tricarboxylate transporter TctB family protein [Chromohalobacter sp. 296-RDG]